MAREMLVNVAESEECRDVAESEECRVAVVENGSLEELYVERASVGTHVGNIYKGKVANIEAGIQAAFIDFGVGKNGFLHISDLHPRYFSGTDDKKVENIGRRKALRERPPIQSCLRKGREIVVQVTKEGVNTKGPTLSTYLALPGKYLVMMPWMKRQGVSQNDLRYLCRLWRAIEKRIDSEDKLGSLYQESDLVIRALRDVFDSKITKVLCDSDAVTRKIKDFLSIVMPRLKRRVQHYDDTIPLFHKYKIEDEIAKIQARRVNLKCGGSIVIEQTEALVAIDVNSGRSKKEKSAEMTAYNSNIEATKEIARQLKLRDLGGLIVCDFIDMRNARHRKDVERAFRAATKTDRARSKILGISRFGVVEMTRQRMRPSLQSSTYLACPNCAGSGFVKSHESLAIEIIRLLNLSASDKRIKRVELSVSPGVADYLQNQKRAVVLEIEQTSEKRINIHSVADYAGEKHDLICYNDRGTVVKL